MASRLGLRARLAILIAAILVAALAGTGVAVYRGTGAQLRHQIDGDLRHNAAAFAASAFPLGASPDTAVRAARRYVAGQPFAASVPLLFAEIPGQSTVTNEPELLGLTREREGETEAVRSEELAQARTILGAGPGYSTLRLQDAGAVRLFVQRVGVRGPGTAVIGVGEPLASAERAQHEVARTFAFAGSLTLLVALAAGVAVAARLSRPLRRMARTAAAVDAGELTHRIAARGPRDEVKVLADAFDHMLDRLEDAFAGQRAFVSDASHELRTPLTVIRGQLEVLARQRDVTVEDVRRVESTVRTEILRMQRLVDDLLLLAQADEHELVHAVPISVRPFVADLHEALRSLADRRFELSDVPEGTVLADRDRLAQAVGNLVRNAVEHTRPGGLVRLEVSAHGELLEVAVEDDGPGIPPTQRDRIFDRFHRADGGARASGGAGLGLAIARAIVEAHGGRIAAGDSATGGARVAFVLPGFSASSRRA